MNCNEQQAVCERNGIREYPITVLYGPKAGSGKDKGKASTKMVKLATHVGMHARDCLLPSLLPGRCYSMRCLPARSLHSSSFLALSLCTRAD